MSTTRVVLIGIWIASLGLAASAQDLAAPGGRTLPAGRWAQSRTLLDTRFTLVSFNDRCVGNGFLGESVPVDDEGRFDVEGQFRFATPVPEAPYFRVRYVGQVRGKQMALTIISLDTDHPLVRAYVLRQGARVSHKQCPE